MPSSGEVSTAVQDAEFALASGEWFSASRIAGGVLGDARASDAEKALAASIIAFCADREGCHRDEYVRELYRDAGVAVDASFGTRSKERRRLDLQLALYLSTREPEQALSIATRWLPEQLGELSPAVRASWCADLAGLTWDLGRYADTVEFCRIGLADESPVGRRSHRRLRILLAGSLLRLGGTAEAKEVAKLIPDPNRGLAREILAEINRGSRST